MSSFIKPVGGVSSPILAGSALACAHAREQLLQVRIPSQPMLNILCVMPLPHRHRRSHPHGFIPHDCPDNIEHARRNTAAAYF